MTLSAKKSKCRVPLFARFIFGTLLFCSPFCFANTTQFIQKFATAAHSANQLVLTRRQKLIALHQSFQAHQLLGTPNWEWVEGLANYYGLKQPDFRKNITWQHLLRRVDKIPTSLVIAQAANESAWGQSRFARVGNNYFGQHCYKKGCGLVPKRRAKHQTFEVKVFPSLNASVTGYIHNLNTQRAYRLLRTLRQKERQSGKPISGYKLAQGLGGYSTLAVYVQSLRAIIKKHQLHHFDMSMQKGVIDA
jgi:Bax protein